MAVLGKKTSVIVLLLLVSFWTLEADAGRKKKRKVKDEPESLEEESEELLSEQGKVPTMVFVTIKEGYSEQEVIALGKRWDSQLASGHIDTNVYNIQANQILFVVLNKIHVPEFENFILSNPEVEYLEQDSRKKYPKH